MSECTVYSPCGRYVVRFASDAEQQLLHLTVTGNASRPIKGDASAADDSGCVKTLVAAATEPLTSSSAHHPLRLVASLTETDVLALTTSAGVRKSFAKFVQMLYDALIGRSPCVHFFVETVTEMKERIQRDVQRHATPSRIARGAEAGPQSRRRAGKLDIDSAALASLTMTGNEDTANTDKGRVRTAVGDTVIELDEDIASEVLEQRFLTLDYDVDFTRAIFPIPLHTGGSEGASAEGAGGVLRARTGTASASPANLAEATLEPFVVSFSLPTAASEADTLRHDLLRARSRLALLESENAKLRRENEALVQLSRHKMHEVQRLCKDFQQQVQLAADAEKLRARNKELRVQLQEALESQRTARRTLDRGRSQRRFSQPASAATGGGGSAYRSASDQRRSENPYLRSLSRESDDGYAGVSSRPPYGRQRSAGSAASRASATRRGQTLTSPAPPPAALRGIHGQRAPSSSSTNRRRSTRFDTPPPPSDPAASTAAAFPRRRSRSRRGDGSSSTREGDGDSPAPHGRTGGRPERVRKPQRRGSSGSGSHGSRASSTLSLPRRGRSLWGDSSAHASPCGSVASSRCSSASHERLYRTATASSRMHQTPKVHPLDSATAPRRAVFH
ncbi:conserved hypothetical protein [Leishmania infantum JPCM5]|uniref:Uncharacterized protein n=2 Tax=Leishmania infantum TaxID=5671 RepID=A4IB92_LEIIN|nr:conserved hypothetical protein [Leishmania infantum JPCM5]CAC9544403.1 hypothetical_protein_-_conserved [Leishmania infantum]CAM72108.1 conserved hypothetical protein [Leishmania infantum JPCM5]SUZ46023.1 hypothetical_protein_-_conserved [Leishmania infantum]|eukprot:XP_001469011.1 conserved hypothetical protein [Leishmania infantum JPCM5]